jgi:hypothetical protein
VIRIGDLELETRAPDDLDAKLQALTGCVSAEVHAMLRGPHLLASSVARALHPFLVEARDLAELAMAIAAHGVDAVRAEVAKLYEEAGELAAETAAVIDKKVVKRGKQEEA